MSRSKLGGSAGSEDKYEQILHKYDWHASRPPRGYVYGIGRGAKAFITTAELTVSTSNNAPHISAEEDKFFSMLDAIEQRKSKHNDRKVTKTNEVNSSTQGASSGNTSRKLSWDELSSIESATVGTTQMQGSNVNNLIPRNARDERVEAAEEYAFSDETHVITAQDVLRGKTTSSQTNLQRILTMGSSTEQSTWITHSRAYREMGMSKKALSTLMEGCAQTGSQGSLIWKELLRYIDANNELARRRVLENAVASCPAAEEL